MSDIAIRAEGLSKQYRLGKRERYKTLRDTLTDTFAAPFRRQRSRKSSNGDAESFWALKDVSFEVKHGEVIGIIGRNGAGKSTLLKVLSRITEPTEGRAEIHGRIASLLEVGTGFHPELSGRDNIFLNGAILGMKKTEIRGKFDEIVAFAEVDKFIDTPVKHYSSGMYVRLAFAVAAHLEPEILIVDEVLAVGDHQFQAKCLNKMSEVGKAGRTVLFVSHSIDAIQRLCKRVIVLADGKIRTDGESVAGISDYLNTGVTARYFAKASPVGPSITEADISLRGGKIVLSVRFDSPYPIMPVLGFVIHDGPGHPLFGTNSKAESPRIWPAAMNSGHLQVMIPTDNLRSDKYFVSLYLGDGHSDYSVLEKVLQIQVDSDHSFGSLRQQVVGNLYLPTAWRYVGQRAVALDALGPDKACILAGGES